MNERDILHRFLFAERGVRGEWVRLDRSLREILSHGDYPPAVQRQLGQALAAAALLAATIKFKGALILQAQGAGPLRSLVAQATHKCTIRGLARHRADVPDGALPAIYGQGHLLLTVQSEHAEPYQGIVELRGNNLAEALELYFTHSEQLPTRLWLYAGATQAVGLLLQEMPGQQNSKSDWERLQILAAKLTEDELQNLGCVDVLHCLFPDDDIRIFGSEPVTFHCTCGSGKIETALVNLGRAALEETLLSQGEITVDCEFCNRRYRFGQSDVERICNAAIAAHDTYCRQ